VKPLRVEAGTKRDYLRWLGSRTRPAIGQDAEPTISKFPFWLKLTAGVTIELAPEIPALTRKTTTNAFIFGNWSVALK